MFRVILVRIRVLLETVNVFIVDQGLNVLRIVNFELNIRDQYLPILRFWYTMVFRLVIICIVVRFTVLNVMTRLTTSITDIIRTKVLIVIISTLTTHASSHLIASVLILISIL